MNQNTFRKRFTFSKLLDETEKAAVLLEIKNEISTLGEI